VLLPFTTELPTILNQIKVTQVAVNKVDRKLNITHTLQGNIKMSEHYDER